MSTVGLRAADGNALDPEIGDVRSHPKPWKGRPWKTKVLSEADLDVELENETVGDEHGHSHVVGHGNATDSTKNSAVGFTCRTLRMYSLERLSEGALSR